MGLHRVGGWATPGLTWASCCLRCLLPVTLQQEISPVSLPGGRVRLRLQGLGDCRTAISYVRVLIPSGLVVEGYTKQLLCALLAAGPINKRTALLPLSPSPPSPSWLVVESLFSSPRVWPPCPVLHSQTDSTSNVLASHHPTYVVFSCSVITTFFCTKMQPCFCQK